MKQDPPEHLVAESPQTVSSGPEKPLTEVKETSPAKRDSANVFDRVLVLYHHKEEGVYPIEESVWEGLKIDINNISPPRRWLQLAGSASLGVAASGIFSLITFYSSALNLSRWVLPTTWAVFAVSVLVGSVCLVLDHQQKDAVTGSAKSVLEKITLIEARYEKPTKTQDS